MADRSRSKRLELLARKIGWLRKEALELEEGLVGEALLLAHSMVCLKWEDAEREEEE